MINKFGLSAQGCYFLGLVRGTGKYIAKDDYTNVL
jgi:hypothetical protein